MLRFAVILGLIGLATLAAAYASFDPGPEPLPQEAELGVFRFAIPNDPGSMDPGRTSASTDFRVVKCLYEPLLVNKWTTDSVGGFEPGTASALPIISEDKLTYTYTIRGDAKWSDGERVTAHDFVFGWRRAMLKETAGKYHSLFDIIAGVKDFKQWRTALVNQANFDSEYPPKSDERKAFLEKYPDFQTLLSQSPQKRWAATLKAFDQKVGIKAIDDRTLEVKLSAPANYFLALTAFPTFAPLPRHILEPMASVDDAGWYLPDAYFGDPDQLVTNGAYHLGEWRRKVRMVFDQNPHYWNKANMGNRRIVQETIADTSLQMLRYEEGLLDWIPNVGSINKKLMEIGYEDAHVTDNAGTYYYEFNCRPKLPSGADNPMTDPRVRRALGMCIDREQVVTSITEMNERIALLMVPDSDIPGYDGPVEAGLKFDPEAARALLAEAGYPGGEGFPAIEILVNNDAGPGHANIALPIKKAWEDHLGLNVSLEQIEFKVLLERATNGNFYVRRAGWFGDYNDPTTWLDMYRVGDSNNDAGYENPEYDELLRQAAAESDAQKRFDLLRQAEAILIQDAPIVPIFYYATVSIYDASTTTLRPNAWNNHRLEFVSVDRDPDTPGIQHQAPGGKPVARSE